MKHNRFYTAGIVLVMALAFLLVSPGSSSWAGLKDMGGVMVGGKPDLSSILMDKLGINAPDANMLRTKNRTVTGEVADPAKLSEQGMKASAGDKLELTNMGGNLGIKNMLSGDMLKLDWDSLLGAASKFMK